MQGSVILENGDTIESTSVISSAGIQNTLGTFLRDEISLDSYNRNLSNVKPFLWIWMLICRI